MKTPQTDINVSYIQWKAWSNDNFGVVTAKDEAVFTRELRNAGVVLSDNSSILEIGFGNGAFSGWARRQTPHYVGTENNSELVTRAQQFGVEAYQATLYLDTVVPGKSYDLIALFDVLEHVEKSEIIEMLKSASRCLSPGGRVIIRVPSGDSPFSGHLMHGDVTHKTQLGSYAFYQLATMTGLEVISVHKSAYPIFGLGLATAIRRLSIVPIRNLVEAIIRNIYYANESVVLAPTLVAVLQLASEEK